MALVDEPSVSEAGGSARGSLDHRLVLGGRRGPPVERQTPEVVLTFHLKPSRVASRWKSVLLGTLLAGLLACAACRPQAPAAGGLGDQVQVTLRFQPDPPAVGFARVTLTLADAAGNPVRLGQLRVEGNMNHAGMKPVFTRFEEVEAGRYEGMIEFTMGGDWYLVVSAESRDGTAFERTLMVPGVRPK